MGKSSSKIYEEIGESLYKNDLTLFASLLYHLKSIEEPLFLSSGLCQKLDIPEDWNPNLLHLICYISKPSYLSLLLQGYPDIQINSQDIFGYTPLMTAVRNRKEQIIEILLSKGANTMIKNQYDSGDSALHYACDEGEMRIALLIISHSTNIDLMNNEGMTPLMYALQKKHLELAETLLTMGADPFITDKNQVNAIEWALKVGVSYEFIEKLRRDAGDFDQVSKDKRKDSFHDTFIEFTDRSFAKNEETLQNPGIIKKTLLKTFDFLVTNQISWVKD